MVRNLQGRKPLVRRRWCSVTLAAAAAFLLGAVPAGAAVTVGTLQPVAGLTFVPAQTLVLPSKALRLAHRQAAAVLSAAPSAAAALLAGPGSLLHNFNGVSSRDSAVTNFGAEFEPPDQGLCVGNGYVVEMVNSAYTVYRPNGVAVAGPFNVNGPFDEGLTEFTSDPRCQYDAATHTWFATILFINASNTASSVDIAVNTTGDPTRAWTTYRIDTTDAAGNGCPCFGDQPTLGIDPFDIYISTNEFSILGPQFNGAQIYAISKRDLVAGASPVRYAQYSNLMIGAAAASSVQPALTDGPAPAEYFLSSLDPNGTGDTRIGVWAMTNRAAVTDGGAPTLSSVVIGSEPYGLPPAAAQKGAASLIDAGDDRMQQVQTIGGGVWGQLDSVLTTPGDRQPRAGAAWFHVAPQLHAGVLSGASLLAQGYVGVHGASVLYPAIQADSHGDAVMAISISGPTRYPSAGYSLLRAGDHAFGVIRIAASGTTTYDPQATRWGDYSWAVLDPNADAVWAAAEYVPPRASQTPDGLRNWGTRVFEVPLPGN
jgi:hypothetical protein